MSPDDPELSGANARGLRADGGSFALSRRDTLVAGAALAAAVLPAARSESQVDTMPTAAAIEHPLSINTTINRRPVAVQIDTRTSLLDLLRERLHLTGAKKGCDHGQCGACAVHVDGRRVAACLTLAVKVNGRDVLTVEGIADGDRLYPMQQAFIDHDALQCGYCTPGQIMSAIACVREGNATSKERIREYMSGNICRCGAYKGIVAAIEDAAPKMRRG